MTAKLVLASGSTTRATILENAGLQAIQDPSTVNEREIRDAARADGLTVEACALRLAAAKALDVAGRHPGNWIIGADQILEFDGLWFEKSVTRDAAKAALWTLRGREHRLVSAVVLCIGQSLEWQHVGIATLNMRPFSEAFLERYIDRAGDDVLKSVGAYRLEEAGAQLFSSIDGDFFTVLGLPLLPLLDALRSRGILDA